MKRLACQPVLSLCLDQGMHLRLPPQHHRNEVAHHGPENETLGCHAPPGGTAHPSRLKVCNASHPAKECHGASAIPAATHHALHAWTPCLIACNGLRHPSKQQRQQQQPRVLTGTGLVRSGMHGCQWPGPSGNWRMPWTQVVSLPPTPSHSALMGSGLWMPSPLGEPLILLQ